jgi:hypothetical protein
MRNPETQGHKLQRNDSYLSIIAILTVGLVQLSQEACIRVEPNPDAMYKQYWKMAFRGVRSVPIGDVANWGAVGAQKGERTGRKDCQSLKKWGSVKLE